MKSTLLKRISFWFLLMGFSFIITLFIAELYIRLSWGNGWVYFKYLIGINPESNYAKDNILHYRPSDILYFWDDKEHPPSKQKPERVIRVFALGDSFTKPHNVGIKNSFYRQIEDRIQQENRLYSFEFFHFGVSGYSELQFLEILRRYKPLYSPDFVIIQVYLGNDIGENGGLINRQLGYNNAERIGIIDANKYQVIDNSSINLRQRVWRTIHPGKWSALYRLLNSRLRILKYRNIGKRNDPEILKNINMGNHIINLMRRDVSPEIERAWAITELLIAEIKQELVNQNINILFVLVPHELQVNLAAWKEATAVLGLNPDEYDLNLPSRGFMELLIKYKLSFLDLTQEFRESISAGIDLYDGHFNRAGHDKTAELIYNKFTHIMLNTRN